MKKKQKKVKEFDVRKHIEKSLRASFKKTPLFHEAKKRAKREYFESSKNGKAMRRVHYECANCKRCFKDGGGQIAVDHIVPVIDPAVGFVDFNTYIERLFCSIENLQVLCNYADERDGRKSCHKIKTIEERQLAAKLKQEKRMFYDRDYKVKVWAVLDDLGVEKTEALLAWFKQAEAHVVQWPSKTYKQTLEVFKNRGWAHVFEPDHIGKIILPDQLLAISVIEHLKTINPNARLAGNISAPLHYVNRTILSDADYERIFNEVLELLEPRVLSYAFDIGKLCHFEQTQVKLFVSEGPIPERLLNRLTEQIVTIKNKGGDINLKGIKEVEEMTEIITEKLKQLI